MTPGTAGSRAGRLALAFALLGSSLLAGCAAEEIKPLEPTATPGMASDRWWDTRTFYEVFVRSFKDSNGDGKGDLKGLTASLDYLNDGKPETTTDLGVTGIWLMPIFASPTYHGYDVTDYRSINPDYGTNDDFKAFVSAAHDRGIAVILDFPINHSSVQHPWFLASKSGDESKKDWYLWSDQKPETQGPGGNEIWHFDGNRYYYGLFDSAMPDFNLRNADVTKELYDVADYWLKEYDVDGFRLDGAKHLVESGDSIENTPETKAWLTGFHDHVRKTKERALLVGEIWSPNMISSGYVPGQVDLAFDFDTSDTAAGFASSGSGKGLIDSPENYLANYPDGQVALFIDNHDRTRMASLAQENSAARLRLLAAWQLTQRGTPFLYYGQELGLTGAKPDPRIRTPFPWTASAPGHGFTDGTPWEAFEPDAGKVAVSAQEGDQASLLNDYKRLIALRSASPAITKGEYERLEAGSYGVFAYLRKDGAESVLVIGNASNNESSDYGVTGSVGDGGGPWTSVVGGDVKLPEGSELTAYKPVPVLQPGQVIVLHRK